METPRKIQFKIAITWPWNTGKTTILNHLAENISKLTKWMNNEIWDTFRVSKYEETARQILEEKGFSDMQEFQKDISTREKERLELVKQDTSDVLLFDRTAMDCLAYSIFNFENWVPIHYPEMEVGNYDLVILFTEAFKQTNTEQFKHYNDDRLVNLFTSLIKYFYWDKVVEFKNASELEKIKSIIYQKLWVFNQNPEWKKS